MKSSRRELLKKTAFVVPTLMTLNISQAGACISGSPVTKPEKGSHGRGNNYGTDKWEDGNDRDNSKWDKHNGGSGENDHGNNGHGGHG
jgi:hypothetical protein